MKAEELSRNDHVRFLKSFLLETETRLEGHVSKSLIGNKESYTQ